MGHRIFKGFKILHERANVRTFEPTKQNFSVVKDSSGLRVNKNVSKIIRPVSVKLYISLQHARANGVSRVMTKAVPARFP